MSFAGFMSSGWGRIVRIIAGLALIAVGLGVVGGPVGIILAVIGVVPLVAGIFDICIIGRLFLGSPLKGAEIRAEIQEQ